MLEDFDQMLNDAGQPGVTELRALLQELLGGGAARGAWLDERQLSAPHPRVYRLRFDVNGSVRSLVVKRLEPAIAQRNQLVTQRWLPAVDLSDRGPKLLGAAAERTGQCVWHVYEDLGDWALNGQSEPLPRLKVAVDLIAQVHLRFADHVLLPECRLHGGDFGIGFFASNVRDAIRCLEALHGPQMGLAPEHARLVDRLLARLHTLREEQAERTQALEDLGGAETLLHGDLWTTNTFVIPTADGLQARLIDWDHAGVGPISYDLSTFLLRFPCERRLRILEFYREAVALAGWRLPPSEGLNLLFETAEYARFANRIIWPAIALVMDQGAWGFEALSEIEEWFEQFEPVLPLPAELAA